MSKEKVKVKELAEKVEKNIYFRLVRTDRNLFKVEQITVENDKVVNLEADEASYLPIAFDKLRRRTAESYFAAVQNEAKGTV
jgi:hypothetical protein